jgi:capsular exopolysaccharide synthesis family protein
MARKYIPITDFFSLETSFATEFRRLLHNILDKDRKTELKTVLVTSSTLSEGKSTTCALLAITAAKNGTKTLLIDCDLRRPSVHKLFQLERDRGTSEVLAEGMGIKNVIKKSGLDKLDVITAGRVFAHPAEVFDSPTIGRVLEEVKFYYDLILIDSPPIIPVSDPMLLAQEVDGVVLVVKAGETQREVVARSVEIITSNQSKLLGVILNNVGNTLPFYYNDHYYGYRYEQKAPNGRKGSSAKSNSSKRPPERSKPDSTKSDASLKGKIPN